MENAVIDVFVKYNSFLILSYMRKCPVVCVSRDSIQQLHVTLCAELRQVMNFSQVS